MCLLPLPGWHICLCGAIEEEEVCENDEGFERGAKEKEKACAGLSDDVMRGMLENQKRGKRFCRVRVWQREG
jgi:hypothetical protein